MDLAALATCTLYEGMTLDVYVWANDTVDGIFREIYPSSSGNSLKDKRGGSSQCGSSLLPSSSLIVLTKDLPKVEMSHLLKAPLSSLVKSGNICKNQSLNVKVCHLYRNKLSSP